MSSSLLKLRNPAPVAVISISEDEGFSVRGISPGDMLGLYYRHTGQISSLFEELVGRYQSLGAVQPEDIQGLAVKLLNDAPAMIAEVIAVASGGNPATIVNPTETDAAVERALAGDDAIRDAEIDWALAVAIAARLPFPVQAAALEAIGRLTFSSDMPPGKFVALIAGAVSKALPKRPSSPEA